MKSAILIAVNLVLVALFIWLFRKPSRLSYYQNGKWWLTWLSVAVITLMDELTSVFYAPAEAYRFIGSSAIFFIAGEGTRLWQRRVPAGRHLPAAWLGKFRPPNL